MNRYTRSHNTIQRSYWPRCTTITIMVHGMEAGPGACSAWHRIQLCSRGKPSQSLLSLLSRGRASSPLRLIMIMGAACIIVDLSPNGGRAGCEGGGPPRSSLIDKWSAPRPLCSHLACGVAAGGVAAADGTHSGWRLAAQACTEYSQGRTPLAVPRPGGNCARSHKPCASRTRRKPS